RARRGGPVLMRWRRVALLGVLVVAATSPWWVPAALRPMRFFGVRRVEVSGARHLPPESVVRALLLDSNASVFDDLDRLAARIRAMGGVEEASVGRRLPGTLVVTIRETEPVALAQGPSGLVAVGADGRPLPFAVAGSSVDAPIVADADTQLLRSLETVRITDLGLFADVAAARARDGEVELVLNQGRVRLEMPVDPVVVRRVAAVRRDVASRGVPWRELDGRFGEWVVVRRAPPALPRGRGGAA
ncbi:MAG TPA: FtsQ-type POTRA domain-containing protein, partial [Dongiaceae bacterium]|nr:FtsQ-type POTRA domain-containing protein [Dongiaceae bacterium]